VYPFLMGPWPVAWSCGDPGMRIRARPGTAARAAPGAAASVGLGGRGRWWLRALWGRRGAAASWTQSRPWRRVPPAVAGLRCLRAAVRRGDGRRLGFRSALPTGVPEKGALRAFWTLGTVTSWGVVDCKAPSPGTGRGRFGRRERRRDRPAADGGIPSPAAPGFGHPDRV
jgi:hypothetical protein